MRNKQSINNQDMKVNLKNFFRFKYILCNVFFLVLLLPSIFSQSIVSVKPSYINTGETTNITITGINTNFTQKPEFYFYDRLGGWYSGININSFKAINDTAISANITVRAEEGLGYKDLIFIDKSIPNHTVNYGKRWAIYINSPNTPQIVSVTPNKVKAGESIEVSIIGKNVDFTYQGSCYSTRPGMHYGFSGKYNSPNEHIYGPIDYNPYKVIDQTHMTMCACIPPYVLSGYQDFYSSFYCDCSWSLEYGQADVLYVENDLNIPQIKKIIPGFANRNQILDVSIIGSNTHFSSIDQSTCTILYDAIFVNYMDLMTNDISVNSMNIINDTLLTANITVLPYAKNGLRDCKLYPCNAMPMNKYNVFSIGPSLINIQPSIANINEINTFEINCENVNFLDKSIRYYKVWLSTIYSKKIEEIYASKVEAVSATKLLVTFQIPADAYQGMWFVNMTNNVDGYIYRPDIFEIGLTLNTKTLSSQTMNVYPNPTNGIFSIEYYLSAQSLKTSTRTTVKLDIYNLVGDKILSTYYSNKTTGKNKIDLNAQSLGLKPGIYIIKLDACNEMYYSKIIYQK